MIQNLVIWMFSNLHWNSDLLQDGSGEIATEELLGVMRAMGQNPTEDELLNLVMEIDIDGNGIIDFYEFVAMMKKKALEVDDKADLIWFESK